MSGKKGKKERDNIVPFTTREKKNHPGNKGKASTAKKTPVHRSTRGTEQDKRNLELVQRLGNPCSSR